MKTIKIGIMPLEEYKKRTIAIAKGEYVPKKNEPKLWFSSLESASQVLSSKNQELLNTIRVEKPKSLTELEALTGRRSSNLSRTLKTMEKFGLVKLKKEKRNLVPEVVACSFEIAVKLQSHSCC